MTNNGRSLEAESADEKKEEREVEIIGTRFFSEIQPIFLEEF